MNFYSYHGAFEFLDRIVTRLLLHIHSQFYQVAMTHLSTVIKRRYTTSISIYTYYA